MDMLAIDVTSLLDFPIRTGIQRVVRKLLQEWPDTVPRQLVYFDEARAAFVPARDAAVELCVDLTDNPHMSAAEAADLVRQIQESSSFTAVTLSAGDKLLMPELFSAPGRVAAYDRLYERQVIVRPVVHDLLLWTSPQVWNVTYLGGLNDYLRLIMAAGERLFESSAVRRMAHERIFRRTPPSDVVALLGADSLQRTTSASDSARPYFVCLGTFDNKKRQDIVHRAWLASKGRNDLDLVFVGGVQHPPQPEHRAIFAPGQRGLRIVNDPNDTEVARLVQNACASIMISRYEGYGLPAVESLFLGTPVVAAADLPSLADLGSGGQIRLDDTDVPSVSSAMDRFADPAFAAGMRKAAERLSLPTWSAYACSVADWASS
jgi:glycosyltransferase involved in cell wall biosynthesis